MTTTYYASSGAVYPNTTYTPTTPTFIPPALVIKNIGAGTFAVRKYADSTYEGDQFKLAPGEWVSIAIPDGETYQPGLTDADSSTGGNAFLLGWTDE
jgi:hypothetical protein